MTARELLRTQVNLKQYNVNASVEFFFSLEFIGMPIIAHFSNIFFSIYVFLSRMN